MIRINVILIVYFILNFNSGCCPNDYKVLQLENDSFKVTIQIKEPIKINNKSTKYWTIKGLIKIENKRASITKYCNGLIRLKINDKYMARCYVDTYASMIIDYGLIDLKPNEKQDFEVYWKFHETIDKIDKLDLTWNFSKLGL